MHSFRFHGLGVVAALALGSAPAVSARTPAEPPQQGFIENRGQTDPAVRFYALGQRTAVYFTDAGPVLELLGAAAEDDPGPTPAPPLRAREQRRPAAFRRHALRIRFAGAVTPLCVEGLYVLPARYRFFVGHDPAAWRSDVPAFDGVAYRDVWPGVDVVYRDLGGRLTYEILAAPGADAAVAKFEYEGASAVRATADATIVETPVGVLRDEHPGASASAGVLEISLEASVSDGVATLRAQGPLAAPASALNWGTYLGGARDDEIFALVLDSGGRPVVAGTTRSPSFPTTPGVVGPAYDASFDAFVSKFSADGGTLLWSTFLGAGGDDRAWALALDSTDRPVVAGVTTSTTFPVTPGAYDTSHNGSFDAFLTKLSADGTALVWSTFFGGSQMEWDVSGLALDATSRPAISGSTRSAGLPTTPGALDATLGGAQDAFVARFTADAAALVFATYLGGTGFDTAEALALDATGRVVVAGSTDSPDFPTTPGAFQTASGSAPDAPDAFLVKLGASGGTLAFGTYLGGSGADHAFAVALDAAGLPVVTGSTTSADFPTTPGAVDRSYSGTEDAFATRLDANAASLAWSTYLGGAGADRGLAVDFDDKDRAVLAGWTCSTDFPLAGTPLQGAFAGPCDGFQATLHANGRSLDYATFLGGSRDDVPYALAVDVAGRPVVAGGTTSADFPTTAAAYDPSHNSPEQPDGFVLEFTPSTVCVKVVAAGAIALDKGSKGKCPAARAAGEPIDLIEGSLDPVGPLGIGDVTALACGAVEVVFDVDSLPPRGHVLFLLARATQGGAYTDGAGPGLVGGRTPSSGDCP